MRLFLIGWDGVGTEFIQVAKRLQQHAHQIIYLTCSQPAEAFKPTDFPKTIIHTLSDALAGRPAPGVDDTDFDPPGESLLRQLREYESEILIMMNKKYEWMNVLERKHFYYQLVWYWQGVLRQYQPEAIFFPVVPHTVYDFVIYGLAKLLRIKTIMFDLTRVGHRLLIQNDFAVGSTRLERELETNRQQHFTLADLRPDVCSYYEQELAQAEGRKPLPLDVQGLIERYSSLNRLIIKSKALLLSIVDFSIGKKGLQYLTKQFTGNLKKEYTRCQSPVDWQQKFIYLPLNYQPESTTTPLGGIFADQILLIEILSSALPEGWSIYVKEHPFQWLPRGFNYFNYRYRGYYETISKIKSVRLVPITTDTFTLIKHTQAVATATGSAGWEGVLRGKPALVFGYPWYRHCPGVFKVTDAASCRQALAQIKNGGYSVDQQAIIDYLVSFDRASIRGYVDDFGKEISTVSETENVANLAAALLLEIEHS